MEKRKLKMDKKGVFGLTAVQTFFATILGVALLAYVMIIIMGTLGGTTILDQVSNTTTNETGAFINESGYTLGQAGINGFGSPVIFEAYNSSGDAIASGNWTISNSVVTNATSETWTNVNISYTFTENSEQQDNLDNILENVSTGVTGFFSSINPVYAILAVLVIILILVVLVRVVQSPSGKSSPQL